MDDNYIQYRHAAHQMKAYFKGFQVVYINRNNIAVCGRHLTEKANKSVDIFPSYCCIPDQEFQGFWPFLVRISYFFSPKWPSNLMIVYIYTFARLPIGI